MKNRAGRLLRNKMPYLVETSIGSFVCRVVGNACRFCVLVLIGEKVTGVVAEYVY